MKPLSKVAPGLSVIQIQIQAVCYIDSFKINLEPFKFSKGPQTGYVLFCHLVYKTAIEIWISWQSKNKPLVLSFHTWQAWLHPPSILVSQVPGFLYHVHPIHTLHDPKVHLLNRLYSRHPLGSTDQADLSCFYFRNSWILMERHWF